MGVVGDLYIGGSGVARGYVADPRQTAERFVPDPYGGPGSRMYATGDRARWREGGVLELLGRRDGQVKVRGFRVELTEVEAAIGSWPGVREAAVIAQEDGADGQRLIACIVAEKGRHPPRRLDQTLPPRQASAADDPFAISNRRVPAANSFRKGRSSRLIGIVARSRSRGTRQSYALATKSRNSSWRSGKTCSGSGRSA